MFPTDPDLADILGRMDLDFENFYFVDFFGYQISKRPRSKDPRVACAVHPASTAILLITSSAILVIFGDCYTKLCDSSVTVV